MSATSEKQACPNRIGAQADDIYIALIAVFLLIGVLLILYFSPKARQLRAHKVIFAGSKEVTSVPTNKIADVHVHGAKIVVLVENRANPMVVGITQRYRAPVIAAAAQRMAQRS